jgi:AcrR family transcriptional regulator
MPSPKSDALRHQDRSRCKQITFAASLKAVPPPGAAFRHRCPGFFQPRRAIYAKVQVKKPQIRDAILASAFRLFSRKGYVETTLPQIAAGAHISTTNLYSYFESKLAILYAVHEPWIRGQLDALGEQLQALDTPRERLRLLFTTLFRDIPAREHGLSNSVMQAIATARPEDHYRPTLMALLEERIAAMVRDALPPQRRQLIGDAQVAHFLIMALDGYVVLHHVTPNRSCTDSTIEFLCDLFLGVQ